MTAVAKFVGDKSVWENYQPFQEALGRNHVTIIIFRETVIDIQDKLTRTLAGTEVGRMLQMFHATGIDVTGIRSRTACRVATTTVGERRSTRI